MTVKQKGRKQKTAIAPKKRGLSNLMETLKIDSDTEETESEAECPKCGLNYRDSQVKWICCDGCNVWIDIDCAGISKTIPDHYYCSDCQ